MKLISTVVLGAFLIPQSLAEFGFGLFSKGTETKGHVVDFPLQKHAFYESRQTLPKQNDPEDNMKSGGIAEKNIKFVLGKTLLLKCVEVNNELIMFVYGSEGYFIDRLKVDKSKKFGCNQLLENISVRDDPTWSLTPERTKFEFNIIYKFTVGRKGRTYNCLTRTYTVVIYLHYPTLERGAGKMTDCNGAETGTENSERAYLLPRGDNEIIKFHLDGDPFETPVINTFKTGLKLICQRYNTIPAGYKISVGFIMYEEIILERLTLDSCKHGDEGMYINIKKVKKYPDADKEFTLVFQLTNGYCYKMDIWFQFVDSVKDVVNIRRYAPGEVSCPSDWTSDAAMDVQAPWYKRLTGVFG
ncbi:uncharacterized protein LOC128983459 [Macrosteles quadrilineatus]|uniref:uncharacterized protein LOC128983459 n=1 Tax=Macrosteles quadrilineatus TaxID=74068 RepID=UPI0023E2EA12|nr:uncharacterized protein LOC128983459 [Macrosteles quadrilineatus]